MIYYSNEFGTPAVSQWVNINGYRKENRVGLIVSTADRHARGTSEDDVTRKAGGIVEDEDIRRQVFFRQRPRHPAVLKHIFYPKPLDNGSRARILASPKEGMPTLVQSFNHSMAKGEGTHEESGKAVDNRVFQYRPTTQGEKEGPYIRL